MGYLALALFSLFAICLSLRLAMIWTARDEKGKQRSRADEKEWKKRTAREDEWKKRFVVAAVLFFALAVAALVWPLLVKK